MRKPRQYLNDSIDRAAEMQRNPSVVLAWIKQGLINTWVLRGGGFYGLIFLLVFLFLQAQTFVLEMLEAEDAIDFVTSQLVEAVFKFFSATLGNMVQAFLWPVLFINWVGSWGIPALIAAFLSFDRWGRPYINHRIPQLHEADIARQKKAEAKQAKANAKQVKADAKVSAKAADKAADKDAKREAKRLRRAKK